MIVQIVIQLGVVRISAAQCLIIALYNFRLLLFQFCNFRLHFTLLVDAVEQDCEQQDDRQNHPCAYQIFVQRQDGLLGQSYSANHSQNDENRQSPKRPRVWLILLYQRDCANGHQKAYEPNAGKGFHGVWMDKIFRTERDAQTRLQQEIP